MASTLNIRSTIGWCGSFVNFMPLLSGGQDPALTTANIVLETILGAPFVWPWNRNTTSITLVPAAGETPATQDYAEVVETFGFLEGASLTDPDANTYPVEIRRFLTKSGETSRPLHVAAQYDDQQGTITFRTSTLPDLAYTLTLDWQAKAPLLQSVGSAWSVPDELGYMFNWGFLAIASMLTKDARWQIFNTKFIAHVLGAQAGLDEMQKQLFLGNWTGAMQAAERAQQQAQQGIQARAQ